MHTLPQVRSLRPRFKDIGLIGLILVSACARAPTDPHQGLHPHATPGGTGFVGAEVSFSFFIRSQKSPLRCEVLSPSGALVDCSATGWRENEISSIEATLRDDEFRSTVSFTLGEVGWYTLTAWVDGERVSLDVYALGKHREVIARLARTCSWLERLHDGAWLCDGVFFRLTEPTAQPLDAGFTAVGGDAIWTFDNGVVARIREPLEGESFAPPEQSLELGELIAPSLLATADDVLVAHRNGLIRIELDELGGLRIAGQLERVISDDAKVWRGGDSLMIGQSVLPWVLGSDLNGPNEGPRVQVCAYSLAQDSVRETGCRKYDGELLGVTDEGLLLSDHPQLLAVRATLDDGVKLDEPRLGNVVSTPRGLAMLSEVVPRHVGNTLQLEWFQKATGATPEMVWSASANGTVVWRR